MDFIIGFLFFVIIGCLFLYWSNNQTKHGSIHYNDDDYSLLSEMNIVYLNKENKQVLWVKGIDFSQYDN